MKGLLYFSAAAFAPAIYAEQFMTPEQAQRAMYASADEFVAAPLTLSESVRQEIAQKADVRVADSTVHLVKAYSKKKFLGYLIFDRVVGKHEFITFAVRLSPEKSVQGIEILEYKETYGGEVRRAVWREQFHGKTAQDKLRLDEDIKNISGATLSSRHIVDGIRRLLVTLDVMNVGRS